MQAEVLGRSVGMPAGAATQAVAQSATGGTACLFPTLCRHKANIHVMRPYHACVLIFKRVWGIVGCPKKQSDRLCVRVSSKVAGVDVVRCCFVSFQKQSVGSAGKRFWRGACACVVRPTTALLALREG